MAKRRNLTVTIHGYILQQMLQYQIVAGQRLIFIDLANQFQVSRTPVHNALSILERQGYLDLVRNKGYAVHTFTLSEIGELIELKQTLEKGLMQRITKVSAIQLRNILRCKMIFDTAAMDNLYRPLSCHDLDFHLSIAAVFGNAPAVDLYRETLQKLTMAAINPEVDRPAVNTISKEHSEIFEAIRINDLERAMYLSLNHQPLRLKNSLQTKRKTRAPQQLQQLPATEKNIAAL